MKRTVFTKIVLGIVFLLTVSTGLLAAPVPNPLTWKTLPTAVGLQTIYMEAAVATDDAGVEYFFECVTDPNFNSVWQSGTVYYRNGYKAGTEYKFRVKARDKSTDKTETQWSGTNLTTTASGADTLPPVSNPTQWKQSPSRISTTTVKMEAATSYDEVGSQVQYFFQCVSTTDSRHAANPSKLSSDWQDSPIYLRPGLLTTSPGNEYVFRVRVKDATGNITNWSENANVFLAPPPVVRIVGVAPYVTIQNAINSSNHGDIVVLPQGIYRETNIDFRGRAITVRSENPDNPAVVAATIIDCNDIWNFLPPHETRRAFVFSGGEGRDSVLAGITIKNATAVDDAKTKLIPVWNEDPDRGNQYTGAEWLDGQDARGGAILIGSLSFVVGGVTIPAVPASPTIRNCVFENCSAKGQYGQDGSNGVGPYEDSPGGHGDRGGDGGNAYGGAIYAVQGSAPLIQKSQFTNCQAVGGNAGNGGNGTAGGGHSANSKTNVNGYRGGDGGDAGFGGCAWGGAIYFEPNCAPELYGVSIKDSLIKVGQPGHGGNGGAGGDAKGIGNGGDGGNGGFGGDLRAPNSYAGAVFYGDNANIIIDGCVFDNCKVIAELSGDYSGGNGGNGGNFAGDDATGTLGGDGGHGGPAYFVPDKMRDFGGVTATGGKGGDGGGAGPRQGLPGNGGFRFGLSGAPNAWGARGFSWDVIPQQTGIWPSNMYYHAYYWEDANRPHLDNPVPTGHKNDDYDFQFSRIFIKVTDPKTFAADFNDFTMYYSPYTPFYGIIEYRINVVPTILGNDPNSWVPDYKHPKGQPTVTKVREIPLTPVVTNQPNTGACAGANYYGENSVITMTDTVVSNNASFANHGGGELYDKGCDVVFDDCTFENNVTRYELPAVHDPNADPDTDYRFEGFGGGLFADQPENLIFHNCQFKNNNGYSGGGLYCNFGPSSANYNPGLDLTDSTFTGNKADYHATYSYAGAVYAGNSFDAYEEFYFNNFTGAPTYFQSSQYADHGYISFYYRVRTNHWSNELEADHILWGMQLPVYRVPVTNCTFENNQSPVGGGLCVDASIVDVNNSQFLGNTGQTGSGGYLYASSAEVSNSVFGRNIGSSVPSQISQDGDAKTYGYGAGLYLGNSDIWLDYNQFTGNQSNGYGAALYINGPFLTVPQQLVGNEFEDNHASLGGGAVVATFGSEVFVADANFVGNEAVSGPGGAIYCYNAFVDVNNCNLYDNIAHWGSQIAIGDPLVDDDYIYSTVFIDYSFVQDGKDGIFVGKGLGSYLVYGKNNKLVNPVTKRDLYTSVREGRGTVTPTGKTSWTKGEVVILQATPEKASDSVRWLGTDDDTLLTTTNTVTMTSKKIVEVVFYTPTVYNVTGDFTELQYAIDTSKEGDIIILHPGVYDPVQARATVIDKNIRIQSYNPDDPNVVANTVIVGGNWVPGGLSETSGLAAPTLSGYFYFSGTDRTAILNGLTIRDSHWTGQAGHDGKTPENPEEDGMNGVGVSGGAISFKGNASATIKNCRFLNCSVTGGNGGKGTNIGDGGWGGMAHGGAVAIGSGDPRFINCQFIGNYARGGGGGDSGDGDISGRGGSWDNPLDPYLGWDFGPYLYYWKYSGFGGAVYCDTGSKPEFENCQFTDNTVYGGHTGIGDGPGGYPFAYYKIDRYGGAVYGAQGSTITFKDCTFTNNAADTVGPETNYKDDTKLTTEEDPYYAYGGTIAFEDDVVVTLEDCTITGSQAHHGGAIYAEHATLKVSDCNFAENTSSFGGALYYVDANFVGERTMFIDNDANIPESQGGGIFAFDSNSIFTDVVFNGNASGLSGGAMFVIGGETVVKNALIVNNQAVRDGAGISANWYSDVDLQNCTLGYNEVLGTVGGVSKGGGIYAGYQTYMDVVNSILWGNSAGQGQQIAIGTGFEFDPVPSKVDISYSDVQGGRGFTAVSVENGCTLKWNDADMLYADPCFVSPQTDLYYLKQPSAGNPTAPTSPCIDKGNALASVIGLDKYTTVYPIPRFDFGIVDLGYHYPFEQKGSNCAYTDLAYAAMGYQLNGEVELSDLAILASYWLQESCNQSNRWCHGADLNFYGGVDFDDFIFMSSCWGTVDIESPMPNPSEWKVAPMPDPNSTTAVRMEAVQATDNWIGGVEYKFENQTDPAHSTGWRQGFDSERPGYVVNPWKFTDTGLVRDKAYTYTVKVKDVKGNETASSQPASAIPGVDVVPPSPNPSQWAVQPFQITAGGLRMQAVQATDAEGSGVEYLFVCVQNNNFSSGWRQNVASGSAGYVATPWVYDVNGLTVGQSYTFYVKTRDRSMSQNETGPSASVTITIVAVDQSPPTVKGVTPPTTKAQITSVSAPYNYGGVWYQIVTATEAEDPNGVEYKFTSDDGAPISGNNALWRYDVNATAPTPRPTGTVNCSLLLDPTGAKSSARTIWVNVGSQFARYKYRVQYRDQSPAANTGTISNAAQAP